MESSFAVCGEAKSGLAETRAPERIIYVYNDRPSDVVREEKEMNCRGVNIV